ncbi:hypothetical protein FOCC_FOCC001655 [Frankliniella occidentalis]|nr:hypothetical protein FOCC_FOCC001655 [Frankliniella occidentalis]
MVQMRALPVHESALPVHQVELPVELLPRHPDGRGVGQHGDGPDDRRQVGARHRGGRLVVDADLERTKDRRYSKSPRGPSYLSRCSAVSAGLRRTLKPVGHQSTKRMDFLLLMACTALLTSVGVTSPRYSRQHAMYLPSTGLQRTIWLVGSKQADSPTSHSTDLAEEAVQILHYIPEDYREISKQVIPKDSEGGIPKDSEGGIPKDSEGGIPKDSEGGIPKDSEGGIPRDSEGGIPRDLQECELLPTTARWRYFSL